MRIALLSDIHGNSIALDAVLAEIEKQGGVDGYWILGDLVAIGPDPVGVVERLSILSNIRVIRGNTDRYVACGDRPGPTPAEARENHVLLKPLVEVANTFAWTQGMITSSGWLTWLQALPAEFRLTLPDSTTFLAVHASPGTDDGTGIPPETTEEELPVLLAGESAQLIAVGHTHLPMDRSTGPTRIFNPGAVSLSRTPDLHACYAILDASTTGYTLRHKRVPYDRQAVIDQLNALHHPARGYIIHHLQHQL